MELVVQDKISNEFLSNALGKDWRIFSSKVSCGTKQGDNYMSLIYSAEVDVENVENGEKKTRHLLLKCYPAHPSRQKYSNKTNMFFKELEIYRLWFPELRRFQTEVIGLEKPFKLPYPPFVSGKCIDFASASEDEYEGKFIDSLDNYIIMEDIRKSFGFRMTNRRESMDIHHIRLVVYELAKIHALSWAYKCHVTKDVTTKYPCLQNNITENDSKLWLTVFDSIVMQSIGMLDQALGAGNNLSQAMSEFQKIVPSINSVFFGFKEEAALDDYLRFKNDGRFGRQSPDAVPWRVITHGDCWSNNMLFRYDEKSGKPVEVALVDLQMVNEGCIIHDLVYAIYSATNVELRKNHLEELMVLYCDSFNEICLALKTETLPGFTLEAFKFRFHRYKLIGLFMAVNLFPIMLKDDQEAEAMNMEDMDSKMGYSDMMADVFQTTGTNSIHTDRLIGIVQELYDEGVI